MLPVTTRWRSISWRTGASRRRNQISHRQRC